MTKIIIEICPKEPRASACLDNGDEVSADTNDEYFMIEDEYGTMLCDGLSFEEYERVACKYADMLNRPVYAYSSVSALCESFYPIE